LKQALVVTPKGNAAKIAVSAETAIALVFCAALLLVLGVFPSIVLRLVQG
jgi:NADH-quinone oxidoreductase subunit N